MKRRNYLFLSLLFGISLFAGNLVAQTFVEEVEAIADVVVDINGTGDYTSVQEAIYSLPNNDDTWKIILVKNGTYYEKVILNHKKTKVILVGEDVDSTKITYDDWANNVLPGHTFSTYTFRADANDFQAYNISFECTAGSRGQGVAFHSNGDRQILYHCRLLGEQDTYFDNFRTRRYIKDCFIQGTIDYIFGFGVTLFDSCQIYSIAPSEITAASTPEHYEFGYVFRNCRITSKLGINGIYLGRPWFDWSNTIFYECWEPASLSPGGWSAWSGREATCIYREYNCFGPGSDTTGRVSWGKQLDPALAPRYVTDTILAASNFPTYLGYEGDTTELMHLYRRFEASGYPERADTILYAGRDAYPTYPTENWLPEFYTDIYNLVNQYTIPFMDSVNGEITIENILLNSNEVPGFDPDITSYVVEVGDSINEVPKLTVLGEGLYTTINYPPSLPGIAQLTVLSNDRVNGDVYEIYFSKDSAYWDSELNQFIINYTDTIDVEPGVFQYNSVLAEGEVKVKSLLVFTKVAGQRYNKYFPTSYPGTVTIESTAPDNETTSLYEIYVELYPSILNTEQSLEGLYIINPAQDYLTIFSKGIESTNSILNIYDLNGRTVVLENNLDLRKGLNTTKIDLSVLQAGVYIYSIRVRDQKYSGKFVKE